ncbi:MAG: hypothetical protein IT373_25400 [Polyangiaceae bacterium]|nr:hypothetical protein [Polyangiaceae bacterium]
MRRVYHTWDKWECYPAGFYENAPPNGIAPSVAPAMYRDFLRDTPRFEAALSRVIAEWPNSCEHYLSNENMNRIAWLGQAAMCIATRVPAVFRGGFNLLSASEKIAANEAALRALNAWLRSRGEPELDMDAAQSKTEMNLY